MPKKPNLRQFEDPRYNKEFKKWKAAVLKRDKRRCRMPGCNKRRGLQAHHIRTWANYPSLRFVVSNGITLCFDCHKKIWGHEDTWIPLFKMMVDSNV